MNTVDAARLLTVAAAFDNRKPDADAAQAWALALDGLRFEDCRDAIVGYYRASRDWIMPSDVISGVKHIRAERRVAFDQLGDLRAPRALADDPVAERAWMVDKIRRIGDGEITSPDQIPDMDVPGLPARDVAALGLLGRKVPRA